MQLAGPDTATVDLATCVYLDLENDRPRAER